MKWLLGTEAIFGALMVAAVVRTRGVRQSNDAVDFRIHLVFGSSHETKRSGILAPLADGLAYLLRLFFVHVLGAELRPRRGFVSVVTPPCDDCIQP